MNLEALDAIMEATRKKRLAWQKINPERFETVGEPKVSIQFHYPQVGDESTTGADIAVITFGGVSLSVFAGTEGMAKARTILGAAFVDWQ